MGGGLEFVVEAEGFGVVLLGDDDGEFFGEGDFDGFAPGFVVDLA